MIYTVSKKALFIVTILLGAFNLLFGITFGYNPTSGDIQQINSLKISLNKIISGSNQDLWSFYYQLKNLQNNFGSNPKLNYMLNDLKEDLYVQFYTKKNLAKQQSKDFKQTFVNNYISGVIIDSPIPGNCTGRYNTLDDMSFAYNIPTALTIATRYRETTCGYYLPGNGDGPFQILSKDYGTGQITEDIFIQSAQDFMGFTKSKQTQYKTKLGIKVTYTGFDWTGLANQGALYNGGFISGNIVMPNAPKYLYDGYGIQYSGAMKYGLIPKFIKFLDREIKNKY